VFPVAPSGLLLFRQTGGSFGEGGDALRATLLRQWIPALAGELAVGERLLSSLCQGDQGEAAESELTVAVTDDEALNPTPGSGRLDEEIEVVAGGVSSGRSGGKRTKGPFGDGGWRACFWLAVGRSRLHQPFPRCMGDGSGL